MIGLLSEADVKKYKEIQSRGIPVSPMPKLVSLKEATEIVGRTNRAVLGARMENPATTGSRGITWFVVGAIIMLNKSSLIKEALRRGWIEEVK